MMRSSNPALSEKRFTTNGVGGAITDERMTVSGAVNKSFFLIGLVFVTAYFSWQSAFPEGWAPGAPAQMQPWFLPALIGGFILSLVIIFKSKTAPYLSPVYAVAEGAVLGGLSAMFEMRYPGVVLQAVFCTLATFLSMLFAYKSGLIRATETFKRVVVIATLGIFVVYLIDLVMNLMGNPMPYLHSSSPMSIGISAVITCVAALNLILDFDFIEQGAQQGAPKYMEWYSAFGLLLTLVWLYMEFLRLLGKTRR
ncbi:Bax inhibitor-1/YccA family protein [soil metagenome]